MKRYDHNGYDVLTESEDGEWVKFSDVPQLDKPSALLAMIGMSQYLKGMHQIGHELRVKCDKAAAKLAAAILAEVEADETCREGEKDV